MTENIAVSNINYCFLCLYNFFFWHNTAIQLQNYKIYLYSALQTQKLVTTPTTYIWYWYYQTCTAFCDQTLQRNTEKRAGPFIKTDM